MKQIIDEITGEIIEVEETEEKELFVIDDDNKADWAIQKIKERRAEKDRLIEIAKHQITELKARIEALENECIQKNSYLENGLMMYFYNQKPKVTKTKKSYKLLNGTLSMSIPQPKIVKKDEEKLVEYLKATNNEDFIKRTESVIWGEFKKTLVIDGETVKNSAGEAVEGVAVEKDEVGEFKVE